MATLAERLAVVEQRLNEFDKLVERARESADIDESKAGRALLRRLDRIEKNLREHVHAVRK